MRFFSISALLFLFSVLNAQCSCDVEVKILLSPTEDQAAITAFHFKKETTGLVYFFDTSTLDLLSRGVIVRLRQGIDNDLTVKLRPSNGEKFSGSSTDQETFKCEIDFIGDGKNPAYSISQTYTGNSPPQTGYDIFRLFSPGQKKLLEEIKPSIDWNRVERTVEIRATDWQSKSQRDFNKLTLELWEWPEGRILEISTKTGFDAGPAAFAKLRDLVSSKFLSLSRDQRSKTIMVLESSMKRPPATGRIDR